MEQDQAKKMRMKKSLLAVFNWLQDLCKKLNRSQKFYFFSIVIFFIGIVFRFLPFQDLKTGSLQIFFMLLACAIGSDMIIAYKKTWETLLGKAALLLLYAAATNVAYAAGSQIVNQIVKFSAPSLTYTINFVTILSIPFFIFIFSYILLFVGMLIFQFYMLVVLSTDQLKNDTCFKGFAPQQLENYAVTTFFVRLIAFGLGIGFFWGYGKNALPSYETFVEDTTKSFIYHFDSQQYSRCKTSEGEKVIAVNDNEIVIIKKSEGKYLFTPSQCVPIINRPN